MCNNDDQCFPLPEDDATGTTRQPSDLERFAANVARLAHDLVESAPINPALLAPRPLTAANVRRVLSVLPGYSPAGGTIRSREEDH